ncbi:MAG: penicillin acylase family protein [Candidatus Hydrogenedentes bacterium]|nr:penicillin acylase family protein [Candidatus Hydrogenedentota bacterium]
MLKQGLLPGLFALLITISASAALPGTGDDAGKTVVYRDTWGIPHIYAPTEEAGLYAMGYLQAEDRPLELLKNMARGLGESSRFEGEGGVKGDTLTHMLDHYGVAQRNYEKIDPAVRKHLEAYAQGMNDWYNEHPADVPEWWGSREIDAQMIVAWGRLFLYGWSIDDAISDLERGGVEPGFDETSRGSNQFAISPQRTAAGNAILYIDPHLGWFGASRFWECRIHAGALNGSGFNLPGSPYIGLGHNENVAWAMTTGGPDTGDIYELTLKEGDSTQYLYDGAYRPFTTRTVSIPVKDAGPKEVTLMYSHHGPIVALRNGKAYAAKIAYADSVELSQAWYMFNIAKDYKGIVDALDLTVMFPQNIMVADSSGNTYYQRTGRVPRRPEAYDYTKPVDGSTSASEWLGIHPASDHVQVLNPAQGYMQNCNIPPDAMMVNSPLIPGKYPSYIYSDIGYGPRGGWSNPRGARAVELLQADDSVTIEEALAYAVDLHPFGVERWVTALRQAHEALGASFAGNPDYAAGMDDILKWDLRLAPDSTGALKYFYWRQQILADHGEDSVKLAADAFDQFYNQASGAPLTQPEMGDEEKTAALESFANAMAAQKKEFGLEAVYGDKFRVGRDNISFPVGGGGPKELGLTTLRNVGYSGDRDDYTRWGRSGQTSTQIVELSKPVRSWTGPPIGQSDRPDSPHYYDQAEKLFSPGIMKSTWWTPEELESHVESRTVLAKAPGSAGGNAGDDPLLSVLGVWDTRFEIDGNEVLGKLTLKRKDGELIGTLVDAFGETPILDATFEGNKLYFRRQVEYQGSTYDAEVDAVVEADALTGEAYSDAGSVAYTGKRVEKPAPLTVATAAPAATPAAPAAGTSVLGAWTVEIDFDGNKIPGTMLLSLKDDGALQGKYTDTFGDTELYDLDFDGKTLLFGRTVEYQGSTYDISFEGEVAAESLTGYFATEAGDLDVKGTRTAKLEAPAAAPSPVAGEWAMELDFDGNKVPGKMVLSANADGTLKGVYADAFGDSEVYDLDFDGKRLLFGRTVAYQGSTYDISFEGEVDGDTVTGYFATEAGDLEVTGKKTILAAAPADTPAPAAVPVPAETPAPAAAPGPDYAAVLGAWDIALEFEGTPVTGKLNLKLEGGKLAGTLTDSFGESPLYDIEFDGSKLFFGRSVEYQGTTYEAEFEGTVENGALKGQAFTDAGALDVTGTRVEQVAATPAPSPAASPNAALLGEWESKVEFEGNSIVGKLTLTEENGALKGSLADSFGDTPVYDLEFDGAKIFFGRTVEYQGTKYDSEFEGKLEGDTINGEAYTDAGSIAVVLTRIPAAAAVPAATPAPEAVPAPAPAAEPAPAATPVASNAGVLGTWETKMNFEGNEVVGKIVFEEKDGKLSGTMTDFFGETPVYDVEFDGKKIFFGRTVEYEGSSYDAELEGAIEGDTFKGEAFTDAGALAITGKRIAAATVAAAPSVDLSALVGAWAMTLDFQGTSVPGELVFTLNGNQAKATWTDQTGASDLYDIEFDGKVLQFGRTVNYEGSTYDITFEGEVSGNTIKGAYATEVGDLAVTGTRPDAAPAALAGVWHVTTVSQLGTIERQLKIAPDLTGWYGQPEEQYAIQALKQEGDALSFRVTVIIQGTEVELRFAGKLEANKISGQFTTDYGNAEMTAIRGEEKVASDPDLLQSVLTSMKTALEGKDVDGVVKLYADDFKSDQGGDKEATRTFLIDAKDQGYLEDLDVNIEDAEIEITGTDAVIENVELEGLFGVISMDMELEKRNDQWLIVYQSSSQ